MKKKAKFNFRKWLKKLSTIKRFLVYGLIFELIFILPLIGAMPYACEQIPCQGVCLPGDSPKYPEVCSFVRSMYIIFAVPIMIQLLLLGFDKSPVILLILFMLLYLIYFALAGFLLEKWKKRRKR